MKATTKYRWADRLLTGAPLAMFVTPDTPIMALTHDLERWYRRTKKGEVGQWVKVDWKTIWPPGGT